MGDTWPFEKGALVQEKRRVRDVNGKFLGYEGFGPVLTVAKCQQSEGTGATWRVYFERIPGVIEEDAWNPSHTLITYEPEPEPEAPWVPEHETDELEIIANTQFGIF